MATPAPAPQRRRAKKPAKKSPIKYFLEYLIGFFIRSISNLDDVIIWVLFGMIVNAAFTSYSLSQMQVIKPEPYKVTSTVNARG